MNVWSHPVPAVWRPRSGRFVVRGPDVQEVVLYAWRERPGDDALSLNWALSVEGWARKHGWTLAGLEMHDGHPPCIFCGLGPRGHIPSWNGALCRPTCIMQGCERDTCIQAVVNGYQPACLRHFFEERVMVRGGVR